MHAPRTHRRVAMHLCRLAPAALLLSAGCGSMRLSQIPLAREGDWPMFEMTAQHVPVSPTQPVPPLVLEWDQDVQAGIGSGSPVVVDSIVYIGNLRGDLQALHVRTGKRIGSANFGDAIQGSPVIRGRTAYLAFANTRESLVAFDLVDGRPAWKRSYGEVEVSPLWMDGKLYIGNLDGSFFCVEPATGDSVWRFTIPDNIRRMGIRSSPAGFSTTVIFGADNGIVYALDADKGTLRWSYETGAPVMAPPTIMRGSVYAASLDGTLTCLDVGTGARRWRFATGGALYGAAAGAGDLVVIGSLAGSVFALRAENGELAWKANLGAPVNTMALSVGNVVFIGTLQHQLIALQSDSGREVWRTDLPGRVKTSPAACYDRLFVATDEKDVLSFRSTAP